MYRKDSRKNKGIRTGECLRRRKPNLLAEALNSNLSTSLSTSGSNPRIMGNRSHPPRKIKVIIITIGNIHTYTHLGPTHACLGSLLPYLHLRLYLGHIQPQESNMSLLHAKHTLQLTEFSLWPSLWICRKFFLLYFIF